MTASAAALLALAADVEATDGPDRDLDARIEGLIGPESEYPGSHLLGGFTAGRKAWLLEFAPRYTASVDAALALMRERLPNWTYSIDAMFSVDRPCVGLFPPEPGKPVKGAAPTLPQAITAAVLRAVAGEG